MPKRDRAGNVIRRTLRRKKYTKKMYAKRRVRAVGRRLAANYSFHRWVTSLSGANVSACTYNTGTSVLTATSANASCSFSLKFTIADLPNYTEFSSLFDSYMITGVLLQVKMIHNPNSVTGLNDNTVNTANNWYPTVWYVSDHDDSDTITLPQIKEFEKVRHKVLQPNRELNVMLRPTTLTQIYRTAATTSYANNYKRTWLDMAQTDTPHYGIKMVFDFEGLTPTASYSFKINAKFYIKCKSVR